MKKFLCSMLLLAIGGRACAQYNMGVSTGNWCSTGSLTMNPASIAERGEKIAVEIFSISAGIDNNLGHLSSQGGLFGAINRGNTSDVFTLDNSRTFSLMAPYAEAHGPGIIFAINRKHSIALTTRIRGYNQFNNFDRSLYQTITGSDTKSGSDLNFTSKDFSYTAHLWSEIGLSYGGVILDKGMHKIKVGGTVRYLGGIGYIGIKGRNLDLHYKNGSDSVSATNSDVQFASNLVSTSAALQNGISNNSMLSEFFGLKSGMGIGGDIGVIYDFTPKFYHGWSKSANGNYLVRLSVSVNDLGSIKYKSSNNSNASITGNGYITGQGILDNVRNFDDFRHYAVKQGFTADTAHQDTRLYMPSTFRAGADVNVWWHFYANFTYISNMVNRQNYGNSFYNQFTFTPRFDSRLISVAVPVTYGSLSNTTKVGFGFRISGFYFGSDDMLALFAANQYGFNFYAGGYVPLGHPKAKAKLKDTDGDGIPDKDDLCPEEPGTKENKGCPDTEPDMEHGGAPDTTDNCPELYLPETKPASPKTYAQPSPTNYDHTLAPRQDVMYRRNEE